MGGSTGYSDGMARKLLAPLTDPRTVVAYVRVSTSEQALGPEAQRAAIEAWAAREGVKVASWHEDRGVSGGAELDARPGLLAALADVESHRASRLVVARRDRLARDVVLAAMVDRLVARTGAVVASAAGEGDGADPASQLMRRMVDAFAEYERALIRSRTRAALAVKAARGERVGQVPYGSRVAADGVRLEDEPAERAAVERARELRAAGVSCARIAATLQAEGAPARGARWHATTVARMVAA